MKRVVLLQGLPGSGKTTYATQFMIDIPGWKRVNKDSLRAMLDGGKWTKANEKFILEVRDTLILKALDNGNHVIVDDTNLDPKHLEHIKELVKGLAAVEVQDGFLKVPLETCIANDLKRPNSVGEQVIRSMHDRYLKPLVVPVAHAPGKPSAIIVDLDGTLAHHMGRDPYDCEKCESDWLNMPVDMVLEKFKRDGNHVLLVSGRDGKCREQTESWLSEHKVHWDFLYMRPVDDKRDDRVVKEEIYHQHIEGEYNVLFVLDDRAKVVQMWRNLGLICFQVAEGNF